MLVLQVLKSSLLCVRDEWEKLRRHDVCFLLTVRPPQAATYLNLMDIPAEVIHNNNLLTFFDYVYFCTQNSNVWMWILDT